MEGRSIELLYDLLPVVVQEQDEEDNDRYDDVVEQPPLHKLHVGGGWQGFVHVGVQGVHDRVTDQNTILLLFLLYREEKSRLRGRWS